MKKYSLSKYNIYYETNDYVFIYNNYTKKVFEIDRKNFINLKKGSDLQPDVINTLCQYGMIVFDLKKSESEYIISNYVSKLENSELEITIMASTNCNFNCRYCYESYAPMTIDEKFVAIFLKFIRKSIYNYAGIYVNWFGGEPLLASANVVKISNELRRICKDKKKPFVASITTNGYFLTVELFEALIKANVRYFQITVDGNKKWHDYYRPLKNGNGTYDIVVNNLLKIKKQAYKYPFFSVTIRNNVSEDNYLDCMEFTNFFKENFGDDNRFKLFHFPIKNWGGDKVLELKEKLINEQDVIKMSSIYNRVDLFESITSQACPASKKNGYVFTPTLKIFKCNHYIVKENDFFEKNLVGYLDAEGNLKVNKKKNEGWYKPKINSKCVECNLLPSCLISCPLYGINPYENCCKLQYDKIYKKIQLYVQKQKDE